MDYDHFLRLQKEYNNIEAQLEAIRTIKDLMWGAANNETEEEVILEIPWNDIKSANDIIYSLLLKKIYELQNTQNEIASTEIGAIIKQSS